MSNLDNLIFLTSYEEKSSNNFYIFNIELIKNLKSYDYYYSDKIHNFSKKFQFLEYPEKKDNPLNIYDALAWADNLDDIYSSIIASLENKKYLEFGKNAKEFVAKFQWSKIIEDYKKILN